MMLVVTILTFFASIWLYMVIPKGFVPEQDTGLIAGVTDAAQDISFDGMSALQRKVADIVAKDPDVIGVTSFVGVDDRESDAQQRAGSISISGLRIGGARPQRRSWIDLAAAVAGLHGYHAAFAAGAGYPDRNSANPHAVPVRPAGYRR